jgi:predicted alpha-1,6-mannanase (GH76 family)
MMRVVFALRYSHHSIPPWLAAAISLALLLPRAQAVSSAEADLAFDSFNNAFYVVSNGRGYYKADTSGGRADFWKQAEMIEMIIDAYERSERASYRTMISQSIDGFLYDRGSDWLWNSYNDDVMWMVIACCRGYRATGNTTYRDRAKSNFDGVYSRGWDTALGGGIWWTTAKAEKNACINGPAAIAACMLFEIYGDTGYLQKAQSIYAWQKAVLFDPNTGKVCDNINSSGTVNSNWIFTYNQGTFIGAGNYLKKLTGNAAYYNDALKAALHTKNNLCTAEILPEYGDTGDGGGFTGIFARWMYRFMRDNQLEDTFYTWMAGNASAAWTVRRSDNLSWSKWRSPTPAGKLTSFGCSTSVAMLQAVPVDYGLPGLVYEPIPLTAPSYNRDVIVENTAPPPPLAGAYTTASMDGGAANTGKTWYEVGYNAASPTTGIPAAGSTFVSATYADHQYRMAPSYEANNAVLVDSETPSGTLQFTAPAAFTKLSFLISAGGSAGSVRVVIYHQNGSAQTNTLAVPDWFNGSSPAFSGKGRVDVQSFAFDNVGTSNPRFYGLDVTVANASSPVTQVVFTYLTGGHHGIFAVSSSTGGTFAPVAVTGYTHDLVVEAGAAKYAALAGRTTATMEAGTVNSGATWFEAGALPHALNVGLPRANSQHTNFFQPSRRYLMAPSYSANNALFLAAAVPAGNLIPADPNPVSALSFLTAACRGPVTINCILRHADGTLQARTIIAPDWSNQAPTAVVANGRVNVNTGFYDAVAANNPRLYTIEIPVLNTISPLTNIALSYSSGAAGANAAILAVSGIPGTVAPVIVQQPLSLKCLENSSVTLAAPVAATAPLACQWQKYIGGTFVNLVNGGSLSGAKTTNLVFSGISMAEAGDYRLIAANPGGSITSLVATVTVISALPDLTRTGDPISSFGGTSPAGEGVANAIGDTTLKYLNFGLNNGSGNFTGPSGFTVTPSIGLSVVSGLRFYTANDEPGRDPGSFVLSGSTDGGNNYAIIASGPLNLPAGRNAPGFALDPIAQNVQQVIFNNSRAFTSYRLSFNSIRTPSASMVQIGEVEILGAPVFAVTLKAGTTPATLTLRSPVTGHLWSIAVLDSPDADWVNEGPISGEITIPIDPGAPGRFYRVSVP